MLALCQRKGLGSSPRTNDPYLVVDAEHRDRFAAIETRVLVSSKQVIEIGANKDLTARWLTENGLPAPRTCSIEQALDTLPLPFIVQPVAGSASIGVRKFRSPDELSVVTRDGDSIAQEIAPGNASLRTDFSTKSRTAPSSPPKLVYPQARQCLIT